MNKMKEAEQYKNQSFEEIKHIDVDGSEYWLCKRTNERFRI